MAGPPAMLLTENLLRPLRSVTRVHVIVINVITDRGGRT